MELFFSSLYFFVFVYLFLFFFTLHLLLLLLPFPVSFNHLLTSDVHKSNPIQLQCAQRYAKQLENITLQLIAKQPQAKLLFALTSPYMYGATILFIFRRHFVNSRNSEGGTSTLDTRNGIRCTTISVLSSR